MPPHRNVPAAGSTPSMKPLKPERTIRSHEENQERAYIAASRRSDRSLEARVESARRASDIHKKRTGRALRVTEQDVMNEEMYEEEDDDIPWRYRNVTSHIPLEDGLLSQRLQSMLAVQLEHQRILGQAVNSTLAHNPQFQQQQQQVVSPGMMNMPMMGFQNPMLPPQGLNRAASGYRHSPYPMQQQQPGLHQRSASIATPQDAQYQQSGNNGMQHPSPDMRRMSTPQNNTQAHPHASSQRSNSFHSHHGSAPTTPSIQSQAVDSPDQRLQQQWPAESGHGNKSLDMNSLGPLTTTLPMETQQLLAGAENFPAFDLFGQQDYLQKPQQPFYSYKSNGGSSMKSQPTTDGLDQTLLGTSLDTKAANAFDVSPASSAQVYSACTDPGFGTGFDNSMFNFDLFSSSGLSSGQHTPDGRSGFGDPNMFNDFLEPDMFGDVSNGAA